MKKYLLNILLIVFPIPLISQGINIDKSKIDSLEYLQTNFDTLYHNDIDLFFKIIGNSWKYVEIQRDINLLAKNLKTAHYIKGNAEVDEYFSGACEELLINDTKYFLDAVLLLEEKYSRDVIDRIQTPLYHSFDSIQVVIDKFKNDSKYLKLINQIKNIDHEIYSYWIPISSSSELDSLKFNCENIFDADTSTAWVEGSKGSGIGEFVELQFYSKYVLYKIGIQNGYQKSKNIYYANNRIKLLQLYNLSDNKKININLVDKLGWQFYKISPLPTNGFRLIIKAIYNGNKYDDTCLSELKLFGIRLPDK